MSQKYPGGFITKSPVAPTSSAASGIWTLDQQQQAQKAGTWPSPPIFIEDLFSTYLYTGAGTTQVINNGVDLSAKGGLVWLKDRGNVGSHRLVDTVRGNRSTLFSDSTSAAVTRSDDVSCDVSSFNSNGFTAGNFMNQASNNYVSWTFREQPKFFDVVTWTGNYPTDYPRVISHNLGSTPGCVIIKCTSNVGSWGVWHRSISTGDYNANDTLYLNSTAASVVYGNVAGPFTSTTITVGEDLNQSGRTYVAYLFAHDAGGFPVSGGGSTNGISCGSFTTDGSGVGSATLGYEPQWVLFKRTTGAQNWVLMDNMRNFVASPNDSNALYPNLSNAEDAFGQVAPNATGFSGSNFSSSSTYIYIAIRRGPMKTPTVGTSVFDIQQYTGTQSSNPGVARNITTTIRTDVNITSAKTPGFDIGVFFDRLRGCNKYIGSNSTNAEGTMPGSVAYEFWNNKYILGGYYLDYTGYQYVNYSLQRAPGFFDEVCYTGNSVTPRTITHNLGVAPELMFIKCTNQSRGWAVYASGIGTNKYLIFNSTSAALTDTTIWVNTAPTSSVFTVGDPCDVNNTAYTYVAYLFATTAGVSKVGTYTGNGTTQTINCGFTGGARFVLIKRTDSTGGWYTYDTSRGMTVLTDPYLLLNGSSAETATLGSVTTVSTGFALDAAVLAAINTSAATYIFLAIA